MIIKTLPIVSRRDLRKVSYLFECESEHRGVLEIF